MKPHKLIGCSLAAMTCIGTATCFSKQPKTVAQKPIPVYRSQPVQPKPAKRFEDLSMCEQLDAIAKGGKSVSQFIANSGLYSQFAMNVKTTCNWHTAQLNQAYTLITSPIVGAKPKVNCGCLKTASTNGLTLQQPSITSTHTTIISSSPPTQNPVHVVTQNPISVNTSISNSNPVIHIHQAPSNPSNSKPEATPPKADAFKPATPSTPPDEPGSTRINPDNSEAGTEATPNNPSETEATPNNPSETEATPPNSPEPAAEATSTNSPEPESQAAPPNDDDSQAAPTNHED